MADLFNMCNTKLTRKLYLGNSGGKYMKNIGPCDPDLTHLLTATQFRTSYRYFAMFKTYIFYFAKKNLFFLLSHL